MFDWALNTPLQKGYVEGRRGVNLTSPSRKSLKPCFLATFSININYIFPENFIEIPQFVLETFLHTFHLNLDEIFNI